MSIRKLCAPLLGALLVPGLGAAQDFCTYRAPRPAAKSLASSLAMLSVGESEPNDAVGTATPIPLGLGNGQDPNVDIIAALQANSDVDYYEFTAAKGDVLGLAAIADAAGAPDTEISVHTAADFMLIHNDDHQGQAGIYPVGSPFPGGTKTQDSTLTWIAPQAGTFYIRVDAWNGQSAGGYTVQARLRRPALENESLATKQTVFVDFDGVSGLNAVALFGTGNANATLSPLTTFLPGWGLTGADESAVIDATLAVIQENLDDLRAAHLNGDLATDGVPGHFDFELLNSRDHADPFGGPNVSRLIIGGTIPELGISTIGIAESIDPGNFATAETGVVLLDLLAGPPPDPNSINNIPLAGGASKIALIGTVVGNIATHELGHYVGNWHTENGNTTRNIMDQGGNIPDNMAGVGLDDIWGTLDDEDIDMFADEYESSEGVANGTARSDVRTAFGLATGATGPCSVNADCDDGQFCNGAETCDNGSCLPGTPVDCDDASVCTLDLCDEQGDACVNIPGTCDDNNACTADSCDPQQGCQFAPIEPCCGNGSCELGEDCNSCGNDCGSAPTGSCGDGICAGQAAGEDCLSCPQDCRCAGNFTCHKGCCGDGICAGENTNNCPVDCDPGFQPPQPSCCGDLTCEGPEDLISCAVDCDPSCSTDNDCADGDLCNGVETCDASSCQPGTTVNCDDNNACTNDDCDPQTGNCSHAPVSCDDNNACTVDTCDTQQGCINTPPACGLADGCCPGGCTPAQDPDCCLPKNASCTQDSQCCSGDCKGNGRCR